MKMSLMMTATAIALIAPMATADTVDDVIASLTAEGFERIHVSPDTDVITVVALKDGVRYDVSYDATSGEVLTQESYEVTEDDADDAPERRSRSTSTSTDTSTDTNTSTDAVSSDRRGPPRRGPRDKDTTADE
jgi:hypothetical protein